MEKETAEDMRHADVWSVTYRDIGIEICKWWIGSKEHGNWVWNYYLYLNEPAFPADIWEKLWLPVQSIDDKLRVYYDYDVWPFTDLDFHGGITSYEKRSGIDGEWRSIKVGCDYNHAFDRDVGYHYSLGYVADDAKRSVDRLHEIIPNIKRRCHYNGKYYEPSEGSEIKPGIWYSHEGKAESDKWHAEWAARGQS